MRNRYCIVLVICMALVLSTPAPARPSSPDSCARCHAGYFQAWPASTHGRMVQTYRPELLGTLLMPQESPVVIGSFAYHFKYDSQDGWIEEKSESVQASYKIELIVGGNTIAAFLTRINNRLQVLPLAYNVRTKTWFNNAVQLPHGLPESGEAGNWKSASGAFGIDCMSCHMDSSQLYYDLKTNTFVKPASPAGLNCAACHGQTSAHEQAARMTESSAMDDSRLFSMKKASPSQVNDTCLPCHSARIPLRQTFTPGEPLFDSCDIQSLESNVLFPDGRSRGDSFTATQWRMNPCAASGRLQCTHCHTGGGEYRFADPARANDACLPCHQNRVKNAVSHTRHKANSPGSICVNCHMPTVAVNGFDRTDHSMRPPLPAATAEFASPNACSLCHGAKELAWAASKVKAWYRPDYQDRYIEAGRLVQAARSGDWSRLPSMLKYIESPNHDEMTAVALIRLVRACPDAQKWPVLINAARSAASPLVRSAAVGSLKGSPMGDTASVLFSALSDQSALVRIRAVSIIAMLSSQSIVPEFRQKFEKALLEYTAMLSARPDDPHSYFSLGNLFLERRDTQRALAMYDQVLRLDPKNYQAMLNSGTAKYHAGDGAGAEQTFRRAIALEPRRSQAHVMLGMLLVEQNKNRDADAAFRNAIKCNPSDAAAHFNLGVLSAQDNPKQAIALCRKAYELEPDTAKYGYTYAFYLNRSGRQDEAVAVLKKLVDKNLPHPETYALLAQLFLKQNKVKEAKIVYRKALSNTAMPQNVRSGFMDELDKLEQR